MRSLPTLTAAADALLPRAAILALVPEDIRRAFASRDGSAALVEIVPREGLEGADLTRYVHRLRGLDAVGASGLAGTRLRVGGLPAFNADYEDAIGGRFFGIIAAIVCGTLLALALGFRSLLVPIKAVALNLLSVAAAFGAVVLVFQDGHGASLLGLAAPVDGTFPAIPILVFCTVFGLSMDYEVFLGPALLALAGRWNWWPGERRASVAVAPLVTPGGSALTELRERDATGDLA